MEKYRADTDKRATALPQSRRGKAKDRWDRRLAKPTRQTEGADQGDRKKTTPTHRPGATGKAIAIALQRAAGNYGYNQNSGTWAGNKRHNPGKREEAGAMDNSNPKRRSDDKQARSKRKPRGGYGRETLVRVKKKTRKGKSSRKEQQAGESEAGNRQREGAESKRETQRKQYPSAEQPQKNLPARKRRKQRGGQEGKTASAHRRQKEKKPVARKRKRNYISEGVQNARKKRPNPNAARGWSQRRR